MIGTGTIPVKTMIDPETRKPMDDLSTKIQDMGMIDQKIVDKARKIHERQQHHESLENLIIEAFTQGLAAQSKERKNRERIPGDRFREDNFRYQRWQLEICRYIHEQENRGSFSETKTRILRHGLKQISQDL